LIKAGLEVCLLSAIKLTIQFALHSASISIKMRGEEMPLILNKKLSSYPCRLLWGSRTDQSCFENSSIPLRIW